MLSPIHFAYSMDCNETPRKNKKRNAPSALSSNSSLLTHLVLQSLLEGLERIGSRDQLMRSPVEKT